MGKRRRKYRRKSEPGWYKDQESKKYAVRVTVLSLLAMVLLVVAVPVVFWAGGGYDAMAGDSRKWIAKTEADFDNEGLVTWAAMDSDMVRVKTSEAGTTGSDSPVSWYYPDEQNQTFSSIVISCPSTECSSTNGHVLGYDTYLNVTPQWLLDKSIAYLRVSVRLSIPGQFHLESRCHDGQDCGIFVDSDTNAVEPDFFGSKQSEYMTLDGTNWTTVDYKFSRTKVLQAMDGLGTGTKDRLALGLNLTNSSLAPDDFNGEVVDWEWSFYSAGGGVKLAGEVYGWTMGLVLMIGAAASTPYWNPTRDKSKRRWRGSYRRRYR